MSEIGAYLMLKSSSQFTIYCIPSSGKNGVKVRKKERKKFYLSSSRTYSTVVQQLYDSRQMFLEQHIAGLYNVETLLQYDTPKYTMGGYDQWPCLSTGTKWVQSQQHLYILMSYTLIEKGVWDAVSNLKVHKNENFFGFDFEFCTISLLVMSKY